MRSLADADGESKDGARNMKPTGLCSRGASAGWKAVGRTTACGESMSGESGGNGGRRIGAGP
jgi:hypothetical protein